MLELWNTGIVGSQEELSPLFHYSSWLITTATFVEITPLYRQKECPPPIRHIRKSGYPVFEIVPGFRREDAWIPVSTGMTKKIAVV